MLKELVKETLRAIIPEKILTSLRFKVFSERRKKLLRAPLVILDTEIMNRFEATDMDYDKERYFSQLCQDYFLDKFIFCGKENGFFLDIGANDPIIGNNTYFFEKNRNWTGIAFEPLPKMREKWVKQRKARQFPIILGDKNAEVEFCEYALDGMSGLADSVEYAGKVAKRYKMQMYKLSDVIHDYASDVFPEETHELSVYKDSCVCVSGGGTYRLYVLGCRRF